MKDSLKWKIITDKPIVLEGSCFNTINSRLLPTCSSLDYKQLLSYSRYPYSLHKYAPTLLYRVSKLFGALRRQQTLVCTYQPPLYCAGLLRHVLIPSPLDVWSNSQTLCKWCTLPCRAVYNHVSVRSEVLSPELQIPLLWRVLKCRCIQTDKGD